MLIMNLSTFLFTMMIVCTKNPIKTSIIILIAALMMFIKMNLSSGSTWIALIAALMFSGGILIMFMILSSFHPNETPKKMNLKMMQMSVLMLMTLNLASSSTIPMETESSLKMFYHSIPTSVLMTSIIILYFTIFLKILGKEKTSMRLIMC